MFERNESQRRAVLLLLLCCLALVGASTGCRRVTKVIRSTVPGASGESNFDMKVTMAEDANRRTPVAVDLVLVKDKKLLEEFAKMTAAEWFQKRKQTRLNYTKEIELNSRPWEWPPGRPVKLDRRIIKYEIVGGVIFANYSTPGAHSALINPRKPVVINFGAEDFTVEPQN